MILLLNIIQDPSFIAEESSLFDSPKFRVKELEGMEQKNEFEDHRDNLQTIITVLKGNIYFKMPFEV